MSERITITIKTIHCIKRSEFKGRADEVYLKNRRNGQKLWPPHTRAEKIKKGGTLYPNYSCHYTADMRNVTLELWEHNVAAKDDFLGSITFDSDSQGERTHYMDGDGGSYQVTYSVDNPYKTRQTPTAQETKPEKVKGPSVSKPEEESSEKTKTIKRLVVCCDGTWQDLEKDYPTNVVKTVQAVKPVDENGIVQAVYYHEGVGAESNISTKEDLLVGALESKINSLFGGALGRGIDRNIQDAYRFLCVNYSPGDEIYLFGFSRGSYTARSLAGMLSHCGLLRREHLRHIPQAYKNYRKKAEWDLPQAENLQPFCHTLEGRDDGRVPITLLACYDTVGSLGIPDILHVKKILNRDSYAFHDLKLSPIIKHALHAMAVDENRESFSVTPMEKQDSAPEGQTLEQVWFPGGHGCVGGGTEKESKLANNALLWMIKAIEKLGLELEFDIHSLNGSESIYGKDDHGNQFTDATFDYKDNSDKNIIEKSTSFLRGTMTKLSGIHVREIHADDGLHRSVSKRWRGRLDYRPKNVVKSRILDEEILVSNHDVLLTS